MHSQGEELEGHALDFFWAFDSGTCDHIADLVCATKSTVLLAGMPSVASTLAERGISSTLIERNPSMSSRHRRGTAITHDLRFPLTQHQLLDVRVIAFDSPWYPTDFCLWLDHLLLFAPNARDVFFSLWPSRTRPAAVDERDKIFSELQKYGRLTVVDSLLRYTLPAFELAAFAGSGSSGSRFGEPSPKNADLVHLSRTESVIPHPLPSVICGDHWLRFKLGKRQVAVRLRPDDAVPCLLPVYEDQEWTLRSVSRRDPARESVDLWLSNGRACRVSGSSHFVTAVVKLASQDVTLRLSELQAGAWRMLAELAEVPATEQPRDVWTHLD